MAGEKNFENKVKKFLKERGWWHIKYFANRNTKSGVPDILACVNGCFLAIEVKAENGKPSPLQIWNRTNIQKSEGLSIILYPHQFDDFVKFVDAIEKADIKAVYFLQKKINENL